MAVIDSNDVFLHAILTRRGRSILYSNNDKFIISKFALGDDEINYNLVKDSDPDGNDILALPIFEASSNDTNAIQSKLIRSVTELEDVALRNQFQYIPKTELKIDTQIQGNTVFSLQSWHDDYCTVSFSILSPTSNSHFLSNGFIVDFSNFYTKYIIAPNVGIGFDFTPVNPSAVLGQPNKYWYNTDLTTKNIDGSIIAVKVGIDNQYRPINGIPLNQTVNLLKIPAITFKIKLFETQLRAIFTYMLSNNLTSISEDVLIYNNDKDTVPVTNYYGVNKNYQNIATRIPIRITF